MKSNTMVDNEGYQNQISNGRERLNMNIDKNVLDKLSDQAKSSPRLRVHYDLRDSENDTSQRVLIAMEPGSKFPIHRHRYTSETLVVIRGSVLVKHFNSLGKVLDKYNLCRGSVLQIPIDKWHTVEVLERNTILFETKNGPYRPITEKDILEEKC